MPNPDEWSREVDEALFGADVDAPLQPDEPASVDFPRAPDAEPEPPAVAVGEVDAALFGTTAAEQVAPGPLVDEFEGEFDDEFEGEVEGEYEDETIVAEPAVVDDAAEPSGPQRGRRAWVVAGLTALAVVIGASAGAVIVGRSGESDRGKKPVSDRPAPSTTTTTTPPTTPPSPPPTTAPAATTPPPAPTAPRPPTTSRRTVPVPAQGPAAPVPPPPPSEPPPTSPPSTPPPSTSPPSTPDP